MNKIFKKLVRDGGERNWSVIWHVVIHTCGIVEVLWFGVKLVNLLSGTRVTFCILIVSSTTVHTNSTPVYDIRKTASAYFETGNILSQLKFKLFHVSLIILQHSMTEVKNLHHNSFVTIFHNTQIGKRVRGLVRYFFVVFAHQAILEQLHVLSTPHNVLLFFLFL